MHSPITVLRHHETTRMLNALRGSHCVSIVALSNMGKSTLLRSWRHPDVSAQYTEATGRLAMFVYVDCNGMLELSGQGFYELILRSLLENNPEMSPELSGQIQTYYNQIIEPDTQFLVPLSFNNAMTAVIEQGHRDLILLFDEFDDVFDSLDGRVFLNLRALKDKYPDNLVYITATVRQLGSRRKDEMTGEFVELTTAQTHILPPFNREEADELAQGLALHAGATDGLTDGELDLIWEQAGGHPRLMRATVRRIAEYFHHTAFGEPQGTDPKVLLEDIHHDVTIRNECSHLWSQLMPNIRDTLRKVALGNGTKLDEYQYKILEDWGLITLKDDHYEIFSSLLENYVIQQAGIQQNIPAGIWIDQDSGDVWVEGHTTESLTELEFKLLSLFYERDNKLTDKYQIVETVWGVEYIDDVDDARIEKLVSRLRAKVEPDPGEPQYIITVRGRGYRLNSVGM